MWVRVARVCGVEAEAIPASEEPSVYGPGCLFWWTERQVYNTKWEMWIPK